ncbi:MAG: hypothetical protein WBU92_05485 [Candidatus Dormiibacterota bacterium]
MDPVVGMRRPYSVLRRWPLMTSGGVALIVVAHWVVLARRSASNGWSRPALVSGILVGAVLAGAVGSRGRSPRVLVAGAALFATWAGIWSPHGLPGIGVPILLVAAAALYVAVEADDGSAGRPTGTRLAVATGVASVSGVLVKVVCVRLT